MLETIRFPVVLAAEKLPDGNGYELGSSAEEQEATLMVGLKLTETSLWLPVVEKGERSLGTRALNPVMLEIEVEKLLTAIEARSAMRSKEGIFRGVTSGPVLREGKSEKDGPRRGAGESKSVMPPLRGARRAPLPPAVERATGTNGKHWRG